MKKVAALLLCFLFQITFSATIFSYKLNKNEKLEGNYSVSIHKNQSCHFLFIKNTSTKKFVIKPFLMNENKTVTSLDDFILEEEPNFLTNHLNKDVLTVSSYDEKKKILTIIDFDLKSGKNSFTEMTDFSKPDLYFIQKGKSVVVNFSKNKNEVVLQFISDSKTVKQQDFTIPSEMLKDFKEYKNTNSPIEAINQNEFVKNGSIKDYRGYLGENNLYFTNTSSSKELRFFNFNFKTNLVESKNLEYSFDEKSKNISSFIYNDKLFVTSVLPNDAVLKSFDVSSGKETRSLSINSDLTSVLDAKAVQDFYSQAKSWGLSPTVTVNKTVENNYKVRLDRVDKKKYIYNYNWFWQHQFMMMQMQMQSMQNLGGGRPGGFGPSYTENFTDFTGKDKDNYFLEFVVDATFAPQKNASLETEFKNYEVDKIMKEFEDNKNIKKFSPAFLPDEMHYVYQDNKTKMIIIHFRKL
jgi:hypothetical protein